MKVKSLPTGGILAHRDRARVFMRSNTDHLKLK